MKKGDVVVIRWLDHCTHGPKWVDKDEMDLSPLEVSTFGIISHVGRKHVVVTQSVAENCDIQNSIAIITACIIEKSVIICNNPRGLE